MGKKDRAFELDFIRGFDLVLMLLMHLTYDLRYEFGLDCCSYLEKPWFWAFGQPVITVIFVFISGICCTFSRNNLFRGLKLFGVAAGLSIGTFIVTKYMGIYCLIIFNVLTLLAVSQLIYSLISFIEKKAHIRADAMNLIIGLIGIYCAAIGSSIHNLDGITDNLLFLPIGFTIKNAPAQADFMPIFPWLGVFLIGCVIGRVCYKERKSLVKAELRTPTLRKISAPFEFLGRHSLIIYLVHQPAMYGILYVIFKLVGIIKS